MIAPLRNRQCTPQQLRAWEKNVKPNLCGQPSPHYTTTCRWKGLGGVAVGRMDGWMDKFKGIAYEEQLARHRRHFTWKTSFKKWVCVKQSPYKIIFSSMLLQSTHQLKPCLLVGVCFSSRAVSCSRDSFWSRFICSTDWQLIWSWAEAELGRWEFWKLGQRSFCGLECRESAQIEMWEEECWLKKISLSLVSVSCFRVHIN